MSFCYSFEDEFEGGKFLLEILNISLMEGVKVESIYEEIKFEADSGMLIIEASIMQSWKFQVGIRCKIL